MKLFDEIGHSSRCRWFCSLDACQNSRNCSHIWFPQSYFDYCCHFSEILFDHVYSIDSWSTIFVYGINPKICQDCSHSMLQTIIFLIFWLSTDTVTTSIFYLLFLTSFLQFWLHNNMLRPILGRLKWSDKFLIFQLPYNKSSHTKDKIHSPPLFAHLFPFSFIFSIDNLRSGWFWKLHCNFYDGSWHHLLFWYVYLGHMPIQSSYVQNCFVQFWRQE